MPAIGCIFAQAVVATQAWPNGTQTIGPVSLPDKYRYGQIMIDVSAITDMTANLSFSIDISQDGTNWVTVGGIGLDFSVSGYSVNGGVLVDSVGNPVRVASMSLRFPAPILTTRQIRGTASYSNAGNTSQTFGMTLVIW
jgi:hypothetical protein